MIMKKKLLKLITDQKIIQQAAEEGAEIQNAKYLSGVGKVFGIDVFVDEDMEPGTAKMINPK